ncbi:MAG TPA: response regulator transcription factor [Candidatus Eisenbacteria bacterium]|nr:response regulator transcription factor [Candidatus Eisenbacteria bacterium]
MARTVKKSSKSTARKPAVRSSKKRSAGKGVKRAAARKPVSKIVSRVTKRPAPNRIRIVVADKLPLDRRSLVSLLATQADFDVVGEAETTEQAAESCAALKPSILLLALRIGTGVGRTPILDIRAIAPHVPILAMAERGEGECIVLNPPKPGRDIAMGAQPAHAPMCSQGTDCLQIAVAEGASGTIRRSADPEVFFHAIRTVSSGNAWYEAGTATAIMRHALAPHTETTSHALSSRELDVAELISVGRSNKEIAQALGISEPTVKKHVGHILDKLGLQDRLQVGLFVARNPLVLQPNGARRR